MRKERFLISEKVQAVMTSQRKCVTQYCFLLPTINSSLPTDCSGKPSPALHAFQLVNHLLLHAIIPEVPVNTRPLDMGVSVRHSSL